MDSQSFNKSVQNQLMACEDTLIKKAQEYASSENRLHNFRVASELQGVFQEQALSGMMAKHTVSIYDMTFAGITASPREIWYEKITDHINYLLILRAMVDSVYDEKEAEHT